MGLFSSKSGSVFDTMVTFFNEDDWNFQELEGNSTLKMGFSSENGSWNCFAQAREEQAG